MAVSFQEMGGSPHEWWDSSGMHAERHFKVAWDDRWAFIVEALGNGLPFGAIRLGDYPGALGVLCVGADVSPFMGEKDAPDQQTMTSHWSQLQAYDYARITLKYDYNNEQEDEQPNGLEDPRPPELQETTLLTYEANYSSEVLLFSGADVQFNGAADSYKVPFDIIKRIPIVDYVFTWHRVANVPISAIRKCEGKLNSTAFLGAGKGIILFDGAKIDRTFAVASDGAPVRSFWQVTYTFRERRVDTGEVDGNDVKVVRGWNWAYKSRPAATAGWYKIQLTNSKTLYEYEDFTALFRNEVADATIATQGDDQVAV